MPTQDRMTASAITALVYQSCNGISDRESRYKISSKLVVPRLAFCGHAFPSKGEPVACWVVAELQKTELGMIACVYSDVVADNDNRWGYANMDQGYYLGKTAWYNDFGLAALEWPSYKDHWFQPKKEVIGGSEFDWYACDSYGNVALFSSAGYGSVPEQVFSKPYAYATLDAYFSLDRTQTRISPDEWGTPNVYKQCSDRGLFVFDWQHWSGPYEKREEPENPVDIRSVDECVRESLVMVHFDDTDFSLATQLDPERRFVCWRSS